MSKCGPPVEYYRTLGFTNGLFMTVCSSNDNNNLPKVMLDTYKWLDAPRRHKYKLHKKTIKYWKNHELLRIFKPIFKMRKNSRIFTTFRN